VTVAPCWAGIDVGGSRKGFDVAVVGEGNGVEVRSGLGVSDVVQMLDERRPSVVAIDSPCVAAPDGERSRECERRLASAICGIRYTPDAETLRVPHPTGYFDWINNGLKLWEALRGRNVIEVFPTASWTRWAGPRVRGTSRAEWTRAALDRLGLRLPPGCSQDVRDAVAAALTARLYPDGTESFGEIFVPAAASPPYLAR
jgi:predicted nuclease with RNAse H fold